MTRQLELDQLNKRYGDVVALEDMTFQVHAGEIFGFVGSNGAGKTTAMRIVLGVLAADTTSSSCRWATSSVSNSPPRSCTTRRSSCSTNRSPASTRSPST